MNNACQLLVVRHFYSVIALTALTTSGLAAPDATPVSSRTRQIELTPSMATMSAKGVTADGLIDEQELGKGETLEASQWGWDLRRLPADAYPLEVVFDLGSKRELSLLKIFPWLPGGAIEFFGGEPGNWLPICKEEGTPPSKEWKTHELETSTRYLRLVKESGTGAFGELLLYELTPEAIQAREKAKAAAVIGRAEVGKRPLVDAGTPFGKLPLVDEIDVAADPAKWDFVESQPGISKVENIFGRPTRVVPNTGDSPKFIAWRLAKGKYLEPGKAYVLTVDFPEDQARSFSIANRGSDMTRGIFTGCALGDTVLAFTQNNLESINAPLSGHHETFQEFFFMNDRTFGIKQARTEGRREPADPMAGIYIVLGQQEAKNMPMAEGIAVSRIRLFEVPNPDLLKQPIVYPPKGVPRRRLFYREEMADAVINSQTPGMRSVTQPEDWYVYHARLMNFLGMNTMTKDLFEFGRVQGWDVGDPTWYHPAKNPGLWENVVGIAARYGLDVLPYYEYAGSTGPKGIGADNKNRVGSLKSGKEYTHIKWAEQYKADITDPEVISEFKRILDLTIVKFKDKAHFAGAWIRPRIAQLPMSFGAPTIKRFSNEANNGTLVTRKELEKNKELLERYSTWWFGKRRAFLEAIRDYLKEKGVAENPLVLYTTFHAEPAPPLPMRSGTTPLVTDQPAEWAKVLAANEVFEKVQSVDLKTVRDQGLYRQAVQNPAKTFGSWEWQYAAPRADTENYRNTDGIMLTYPFNRVYTLQDPETIDLFRGKSGLAMIRHYPLNEDSMGNLTGYFVCDMDRTGPLSMLPEALAVANGDPWYLGYTSGHIFNRGFPEYARRFNANFLALPALPSEVVKATDDNEVVVRKISTGTQGTYIAVVNTGLKPKTGVTVRLPGPGKVTEPVSGRDVASQGGVVTLSLHPAELRTLLVK